MVQKEQKKLLNGWNPSLKPLTKLGDLEVVEDTDFAQALSPLTGNVLRYRLEDGSRVIVRPSGTNLS